MTDEERIKKDFLAFIFKTMDTVDCGTPGDNARYVTSTVFDLILTTWENAHGSKYMAEYFYRIADELVERSNMENLI
jgi:hypothetical protein